MQSQWDLAEPGPTPARLGRDCQVRATDGRRIRRRAASKALENRLRVAFLGRAGATMQDWANQRGDILAAAIGVRVLDPA